MLHAPIADYPWWGKAIIGAALAGMFAKDKVVAGAKAIGRTVKKAAGKGSTP
jgi:hypothetical protein